MKIMVTDSALAQLSSLPLLPGDTVRLAYDAEGCGCAVNGVASLWLVGDPEADETAADTNAPSLPLTYLRRHEVFFDDALKLDYSEERRAFRLSSDGQIYGSSIRVIDRRGAPTPADGPR